MYGLQGHLTAEQEQALSALRARFPESAAFHSDYDLLRYIPFCAPTCFAFRPRACSCADPYRAQPLPVGPGKGGALSCVAAATCHAGLGARRWLQTCRYHAPLVVAALLGSALCLSWLMSAASLGGCAAGGRA